ncbi:23S rRNA (adenine(2503)-C(2))-methyltransferase RlmN [Paenibacillus sp. IB182496]|uniref:Probable dual-specificity RNA methyltransferase RlmN n=1 Tax=Paenibacillus sabuli TaxID=2772509 RepID=A0A927GUI2_9BACL|nr:23S rRNA (adenine(2503)-C(2))-methyltransferase RlmN [Paenibacillus sabuli]MBD2848386.1 23S rRNA (adenine(2503)-C(2))-methyltransferase RlmN [Paenibacillus sabuli]
MNHPSLYGFTYTQLKETLVAAGQKPSRAARLWEALYRDRVQSWEAMTSVHEGTAAELEARYALSTLTEHTRQEATDGTVKFLYRLQDGNLIETVLMRHRFGLSVCVTTQVGCNIGCSFCASGLLAKTRDLSAGEITGQIMAVQAYLDSRGAGERVSHIVVMGIGEPFDNYDNVIDFLRIVMDPKGLAIGPRHITVSTSGLAERIEAFADLNLRVNLAVSLHAPNDELRTRIMRINKAIPLDRLMGAMDYFMQRTNQRITIEYILLRDVNDGREHAAQLAELIGARAARMNVNLIPYNPVDEHSQYQRSERDSVLAFYDTLKKQGVSCSVRMEHGTDIDAACGQLRSKQTRAERGRADAALS